MPVGHLDPEPGGKIVERIAGELRLGDLGQEPRVERARPDPGECRRARIRA